jgi:excisionase family DNA binding protein
VPLNWELVVAVDPVLALSLDEPLLDVEQAAALLNVRPSWVRDATRAGRLPCIRVGRHLRFTRPMLEQWTAQHRMANAEAGGRFARRGTGSR